MSWPRWEGCVGICTASCRVPYSALLTLSWFGSEMCWLRIIFSVARPQLEIFGGLILDTWSLTAARKSSMEVCIFGKRNTGLAFSKKKKCSCDCQKLAWLPILVLWGQPEDWVTTRRSSPFCKDPSPLQFQEYSTGKLLWCREQCPCSLLIAIWHTWDPARHCTQASSPTASTGPSLLICMGATKASWWCIVWVIPHRLWDLSQKPSAFSQRTKPPP